MEDIFTIGEMFQRMLKALEKDGASNNPEEIRDLNINFENENGDVYYINVKNDEKSISAEITVLRKDGNMETLFNEEVVKTHQP